MESVSETKSPMISVIVPVYKVEPYLAACVDSILAQTFTDFELILVDDGSPDRCGEICDAYAQQDPRVRVIHQENQGLSGARNAGMDIARGEYISFVDSDDMISPRYLTVLLQSLTETNADFSVCRFMEFTDRTAKTVLSKPQKNNSKALLLSGKEACMLLYDGRPEVPVNAWGKLFRTARINDLRFPAGRLHEDQAFTPFVCYRSDIVSCVSAPLYYFRERENSITRAQFSLKRYDDIWAIDRCIAFFEEKGEKEILKAACRKRKRVLASFSIFARRDGVEVPKEYRVGLLPALLYLRKHVQPLKYEYFLAQVSPKLAKLYAYERKLKRMIKRKA